MWWCLKVSPVSLLFREARTTSVFDLRDLSRFCLQYMLLFPLMLGEQRQQGPSAFSSVVVRS
jgi:hypothetical protein